MVRTVLIDNGTVLVTRLGYEAGKGETSHTHPFSAVVLYNMHMPASTRSRSS
jgi:hypothetical protein